MTERKAWHGVYTAAALPFNDDYSVDYDSYAENVAWMAAAGTHGVLPNGSLGEYQTLSDEERARVVTTAVEAAPEGFGVMAAVRTALCSRSAGRSRPPKPGRSRSCCCRRTASALTARAY